MRPAPSDCRTLPFGDLALTRPTRTRNRTIATAPSECPASAPASESVHRASTGQAPRSMRRRRTGRSTRPQGSTAPFVGPESQRPTSGDRNRSRRRRHDPARSSPIAEFDWEIEVAWPMCHADDPIDGLRRTTLSRGAGARRRIRRVGLENTMPDQPRRFALWQGRAHASLRPTSRRDVARAPRRDAPTGSPTSERASSRVLGSRPFPRVRDARRGEPPYFADARPRSSLVRVSSARPLTASSLTRLRRRG